MPIRPLDLLDLPLMARYRDDALTLNSTRALTRGNPLGAVGLMAYVDPSRNMYSAVTNEDETPLVGGIIHTRSERFARLLYLAPASRLDDHALPPLLENLVGTAGEWGALHVTAEVDESNAAFVALREVGFSVYAWQRMWDISKINGVEKTSSGWVRSRSVNFASIQSLHHQIVPPLLQPVEPISKSLRGLICNADATCFVSMVKGMYGTVLIPLIHPEAKDVAEKLKALMAHLSEQRNRPVYMLVRSYQTWLEPVLEDLGATSSGRQAVMVKHLAHLIKDGQTAPAVPSGVSVQASRVSRLEVNHKK